VKKDKKERSLVVAERKKDAGTGDEDVDMGGGGQGTEGGTS
jgi:hypothetical protein